MSNRVHYIDWLRVGAVLLLFPFHVSRVFNGGEPFYVKSQHLSWSLSYVLGFISVWHMPLLFFLAGASAYYALTRRTGAQFAGERVRRLLVPAILGVLILIPPQTWVGARFNSAYSSGFLDYLTSGDFLVWNIRDGGDYYGGFGLGHLWFIVWLFAVSLMALPLLSWGRAPQHAERVAGWGRRLARPAWWLAAAAAVFFGEAMPDPVGKNVFYYLVFFVLGYIATADEAFSCSAEKYRLPALIAAVVLSVGWIALGPVRDSLPDPSVPVAAIAYVGSFATWSAIVAAVGYGKRLLDRPSRQLGYLAPASYPVYMIHQTVIVLLGSWVIGWPVGGVMQWFALLVGSVAGTFALYEAVRRIPLLRRVVGA